jgi:hypothetical protein
MFVHFTQMICLKDSFRASVHFAAEKIVTTENINRPIDQYRILKLYTKKNFRRLSMDTFHGTIVHIYRIDKSFMHAQQGTGTYEQMMATYKQHLTLLKIELLWLQEAISHHENHTPMYPIISCIRRCQRKIQSRR